MIKKFVLKYIREHMRHETSTARNEILTAINDGCRRYFYEDTPAERISWIVGELVKNDTDFIEQNASIVMNAVASEMLYITVNKTKYSYKPLKSSGI